MISFLTIILIIIAIISIIALVMSLSILVGLFVIGVPFISSNKKDFHTAMMAVGAKKGDILIDLGCGKANLLVYACKKFGTKGIGYELVLWAYLWAKFNIWISGADVKVYFKDFYKADVSKADIIYCYLYPEVMDKLEDKFKKELKTGAKVVSYGFKMKNVVPAKTVITHDDNIELGKIQIYQY